MRFLIVGLGSIAQKHIAAIKSITPSVEIFALRSKNNSNNTESIINLYFWEDIPEKLDFIIISNPTSEHYSTIKKAITLNIPLFIEKPPLAELRDSQELLELLNQGKIKTYVAFNLRFHPVIEWLKQNLILEEVREAHVYCGSYLPDWRPNIDYRECYSAKKELGGGVHLDLIHDLDYSRWIFGDPIVARVERNKKSNLEVSSMDYANYLLEYQNFYVNMTLNYYRRDTKRTIEVILDNETWIADLINCNVADSNGNILMQDDNFNTLLTYEKQMDYFLNTVLSKEDYMNNFNESLKTLELCLA